MTATEPKRVSVAGVTSPVLSRTATVLAAGRHPLLTGPVWDLVLRDGEVMALRDAVVGLGRQFYDVVVRMNAVEPATVVAGAEAFERVRSTLGLPDGVPVVAGGLPQGAGTTPASSEANAPGSADGPAADRRARLAALAAARGRPSDGEPMELVRILLTQDQVSVAIVIEQADILLQDPDLHDTPDRRNVASLQLALRDATTCGTFRNTAVLLAADIRSIPGVLLNAGGDLEPIEVPRPGRAERLALLTLQLPGAPGLSDLAPDELAMVAGHLADLTDGELLSTVSDVLAMSRRGRIPANEPRKLISLFRYGPRQSRWAHIADRLPELHQALADRVFGQDAAVRAVTLALAAAALGLTLNGDQPGREGQPRGLWVFVGPTGVGKTELAKAIAEVCFGDPEAYFRIDMAGLGQQHDAARLLGAPPGYVGYEQGGELTNAVLRRPAIVILLDEFTKAHPAVFDRLLSVFDDGRVTDAQGRVAYFGEAVIIATSNVGATELMAQVEARGDAVTYDEVRQICVKSIREKFVELQRPEFYGRIAAGVVPFDFLRPATVDRITRKLIDGFALRDGPAVAFDRDGTCEHLRGLLSDPGARALGGRQVRNEFRTLAGRLAAWIVTTGNQHAECIEVTFRDGEMFASADGAEGTPVP